MEGLEERSPGWRTRGPRWGPRPWTRRLLHATLLAATGPAEEAAARLGDVIAVAERVGAVWPLIPARMTLSRLLLTLDDAAGAVEHATAALAHVRAKGNWVWGAESVLCLVNALDALGKPTGRPGWSTSWAPGSRRRRADRAGGAPGRAGGLGALPGIRWRPTG